MGKRGPESQYNPDYDKQARKFCILGATNENLADFFEVCTATIANWMNRHPSFKAAILEGRAHADADIAESLYKRAKGYERPAVRMMQTPEGPQRLEYTHHHAPDTQACIFWLRNRRADLWREKIEHEHSASADTLKKLEELKAAGLRAKNAIRD